MKIPKLIRYLLLVGALVGLFYLLAPIQVCTDRAFICQYTGSRHGYREWFFGAKTRQWNQTSALEEFIGRKFPKELKHEWVSYAGTGRDLFGLKVSRGHGRPGPILMLNTNFLDRYCQQTTDAQKKALYDILVAGDPAKVRSAVDQACEVVWNDDAPQSGAVTNAP